MKNKALLVSRLSTAVNVLKDLLAENSYEVENVVSDTKSALEYANDTVYDIVVINAPIEDSSGVDLSIKISRCLFSRIRQVLWGRPLLITVLWLFRNLSTKCCSNSRSEL